MKKNQIQTRKLVEQLEEKYTIYDFTKKDCEMHLFFDFFATRLD